MKKPRRNRSAEIIGCKVALLLLISVAALSSAVNDLNRIQELASDVAHSVYKWLDAGLVTAYAKSVSFGENSCPAEGVTAFNDSEESRWMGRVAAGKTIEIKGINGAVSLAFPLTRQRTVGPKHVSGRIGNGGRELILKPQWQY